MEWIVYVSTAYFTAQVPWWWPGAGTRRTCSQRGLHATAAVYAAAGGSGSNPSLYGTVEPPLPPPELLSCVFLPALLRATMCMEDLLDPVGVELAVRHRIDSSERKGSDG